MGLYVLDDIVPRALLAITGGRVNMLGDIAFAAWLLSEFMPPMDWTLLANAFCIPERFIIILCYSGCGESSVRSSSSVEILPVTFITSLVSTHWRKSPKKRSRSSRMNWTIALNSSRSESTSIACWTVGFGSGVIGWLLDWSSVLLG